MNEKELSDRIDALEARLMFQDDTIETLNLTITAQWQTIDALTRQVSQILAPVTARITTQTSATKTAVQSGSRVRPALREFASIAMEFSKSKENPTPVLFISEVPRVNRPPAPVLLRATVANIGALSGVVKFPLPCAATEVLSKHRQYLVPERATLIFVVRVFAFGLRRRKRGRCRPGQRRLRGADGIGRRKAVDQASFQSRMHFVIGRRCFARIGRVFVVGSGIECLSHDVPPWPLNVLDFPGFPVAVGQSRAAVYQGGQVPA